MYKLSNLNYAYDELEPYIDTHTLALHHKKHQLNYLNKLNNLLKLNNYNYEYSLEELAKNINNINLNNKEDIIFNLGGVINHNIYFKSIGVKRYNPNIILKSKINLEFNSYENFLKVFKEKALELKGAGYTYLVLDKNNNLKIINFYNQDNPYNYDYIPLICIDLWEHAYYINYENKKDLYIDNFFDIIDFSFANDIILKEFT